MAFTRRRLLTTASALGIASWLPGCTSSQARRPAADWHPGAGGALRKRGEADYEAWRREMPWQDWVADRRPDCIVRPLDRAQLGNALAHARESGQRVAVRSGGHNVAESFLRTSGMLLDLEHFRGVRVEAERRSAWVEPALWGRDLLLTLEAAGLAFPVAHCATVPMGGYLLGGGVGINTDHWGIGCHGIESAEVMLANGNLVTAGAPGFEDLLWAVRGAGTGFFGVVTAYRLRCPALPRDVRENIYVFPGERTAEIVDWLGGIVASGLPGTEVMLLLARAPEPGTLCIARVVQFSDSEAESLERIRVVSGAALASQALFKEEHKPATLDTLMIGSVDAARGLGFGRSHVNTIWTADTPAAAEAAERLLAQAPSPKSHVVVSLRADVAPREDACFSAVDRGFVGCYSIWDEAAHDAENIAWTEAARDALQPFASGNYVNELDAFRRPDLLRRCFSAQAMGRLRALRRRYDPGGVFHDFPGLS